MTQEKIHRYMKIHFINPITDAIEEGVVTNMIAKFNKAPVKATCQVQALKRGLKLGAPVIRKTKAERLTRA